MNRSRPVADTRAQVDVKSHLLRYIVIAVLVSVCAFSTYAHLQIVHFGAEEYRGPMALLDRLFDAALALAAVSIAFCVGRGLAQLMSTSFSGVMEEASFSVLLGVGVLGTILLLLGLAALLKPIPIIASLTLLVLFARRSVGRLIALVKEAAIAATCTRRRIILTALFTLVIAVLAVRAMTPPHAPDESIYHLSVAKLFAQRGRVYPVLDNWAGNGPFLVQMMYTVFLLCHSDIAAKLFSLCLAVVCSTAVYAFGARFLTRRIGTVAAFAFFAAGMVVEVAISSRIDVSLAAMLFLATYSMINFLQTRERAWLYISAMLSGFSLGTKYTAGLYIPLLGVLYLVESFRAKRAKASILTTGLMYLAIVVAVSSPWFIKNFVWFRNPVYPFITGEAADFAPSSPRYFNDGDETQIESHFNAARSQMPSLVAERTAELDRAAARRVRRSPLRFWEYFTRPDDYNMNEEFHYPNYLFLFSPLLVLLPRRRWLIWLSFLSVMFFLSATQVTWIGRILLPIYPLMTLISAYVMTGLGARGDLKQPGPGVSMATLLPIIALVATLGPTIFVSIGQAARSNNLAFILGDLSRSDYMKSVFYYPPAYFINHSLPADARVMMIGAQTSYEVQRDHIADVNWDSTEWRRLLIRNNSIDEINNELKRRGVTHLWVAYGLFSFVAEMGRENYPNISGGSIDKKPDYRRQLINWSTLDLYSTRFLEPVYSDKFGNIVYRIKSEQGNLPTH